MVITTKCNVSDLAKSLINNEIDHAIRNILKKIKVDTIHKKNILGETFIFRIDIQATKE